MSQSMRIFIPLAILVSIIFRIIWPMDMEWKADEILMHKLAMDAVNSGTWPMLGMQSGGGIINAGFSVWPFAIFYMINPSPVFMGVCVQCLNIISIFIFILCIYKSPFQYRPIMLAGIASWAVAFMPVLFSRKIWAQDLLPFFIALMWLLYIHRHHYWTLFVLGIVCAFAGQLHLSGFYYSAGIFIIALISKQINVKQLLLFAAGGISGIIAAIPWMHAVTHSTESSFALYNFYKFEFWLHSLVDTLGINVFYSLGKDTAVFNQYFVFIPVLMAVFIVGVFIISAIHYIKKLSHLKPDFNNPIIFTLFAFVIVPGLLLSVSGIPVRSHYLIGAFPFLHIFLMQIMSSVKERWRIFFITAQASISFLFLFFVHQKQEIKGDYGKTYRQTEARK